MFKLPYITSYLTIVTLATGTLGIITEITNNISGKSKCLDVRDGVFANGTPVQIYDCTALNGQDWVFSRPGPTSINIWNTTYCLDAGSTPKDGTPLRIWECSEGLPTQTWTYGNDNRIALQGKGLCLDLTNGNSTNGNQIQTRACTEGDKNQEWIQVNLR